MALLILTDEQADTVQGIYYASDGDEVGQELAPVHYATDQNLLPADVITNPAFAEHRALLESCPGINSISDLA